MLTDTAIRKAQPRAKPYKLSDGRGLYALVHPNGSRYWRMKYRHGGKEKVLSFGVYPEVSLAEARRRCEQARAQRRDGFDPGAERKAAKLASAEASANTFGVIAAEWLDKQMTSMAPATHKKAQWLLGLAGALNARPIREVTAPEVLAILRKLEAEGTFETTHRVKQRISQVMRYAIAEGRGERDVTTDLRGALIPVKTTHHAAITDPASAGALLRAIDTYTGEPPTCAALKLAPLLWVRQGNLRAMEWKELNLGSAEWRIPKDKMKMNQAHVVPLPTQAVAILRDLERLTGGGKYCFASLRTSNRPMSENTINGALRRLGYDKDTMTGHGFRSMASTLLNEQGWAPDVIERQLAHAERNKVRAAYNHAQYMAERRKMMQAWANYLDTLREGTADNVIACEKLPASSQQSASPTPYPPTSSNGRTFELNRQTKIAALDRPVTSIYVDTEFTDFAGSATGLISIALVAEDGREFYAERNDFPRDQCSTFTRKHILPLLGQAGAKQYCRDDLALAVQAWVRTFPQPEIVVDYDGDWDLLCGLLDRDLLDNLVVRNIHAELNRQTVERYYSQFGASPHHALDDARALRWAANLVDIKKL